MKGAIITILLMAAGFAIYLIPRASAFPVATTTTVIGWNVPSGTTFNNGLLFLIMPLAVMGLFAGFPMLFEQRGDIIVTLALIGFSIGSIAGLLSLTASNTTAYPFAIPIIAVLLLIFWIWRTG